MNTVKDRIIEFYESLGLKKSEFEKMCNLSNGYMNKLRNCPKQEKLEIIYLTFPQLNRTWLLTGEGEMLNSEGCQSSSGETITMSREAWQTIVSQQETIRSQQEDLSRLIAAMLGKIDEQPKKAAAL